MAARNPVSEQIYSCSYFIAFFAVTASIFINQNYTTFGPGEDIAYSLVVVPVAYGFLLGMAPNRTLFFFGALSTAIAVVGRAGMVVETASPELFNRYLGMAAAWALAGFYAGTLCQKYVRKAGWRAYSYSISVAMIGISISSIFTESVIPQLLGDTSFELKQYFGAYFFTMIVGFVTLSFTGIDIYTQGIKSVARQILGIFTLFGVLDFVLFYIRDDYLSGVMWWISEVPQPPFYKFIFNIILSAVIVARTTNLDIKAISPWKFNSAKRLVSAEGWGDLSEVPTQEREVACFEDAPVQWIKPDWWSEHRQDKQGEMYKLEAQSSNPVWISFELLVVPYLTTTETREQLRTITLLYIQDPDGGPVIHIADDGFARRHSVDAYWCAYQDKTLGFVYLEWFAVTRFAIVARCVCASKEDLLTIIPQVNIFMKSLTVVPEAPELPPAYDASGG